MVPCQQAGRECGRHNPTQSVPWPGPIKVVAVLLNSWLGSLQRAGSRNKIRSLFGAHVMSGNKGTDRPACPRLRCPLCPPQAWQPVATRLRISCAWIRMATLTLPPTACPHSAGLSGAQPGPSTSGMAFCLHLATTHEVAARPCFAAEAGSQTWSLNSSLTAPQNLLRVFTLSLPITAFPKTGAKKAATVGGSTAAEHNRRSPDAFRRGALLGAAGNPGPPVQHLFFKPQKPLCTTGI